MNLHQSDTNHSVGNAQFLQAWRPLIGWWMIYAILISAGTLFIAPVHLANGGVLLAALFDLKVLKLSRQSILVFLLGIFIFDFGLNLALSDLPPLLALVTSGTLILQASIGCLLLQRFAPSARLPDTQGKIFSFLLYAVFVPVLLSASMQVLVLQIVLHYPTTTAAVIEEFISWFVIRFTSVILLAPLLLFSLHDYDRLNWQKFLSDWKRNIWFLLMALVCAGLIFSVANPAGRTLATYSYLLLPLMIFIAIRFPISQSLLAGLLVSLVCFWADIQTAGNGDQAERSTTALSVFLFINLVVVWLLGALMRERDLSLAQEKKRRDLYEILSRVNQLLVKNNLTEQQLFDKTCQLIIEEGYFEQVCVIRIDEQASPETFANSCANKSGEALPTDKFVDMRCQLVRQAIEQQNSVFLSDCCLCPEHQHCALNPLSVQSMAVFPVKKDAKLVAVLIVFSDKSVAFDADIRRLLQELADDLGFAIAMYERRSQLNQIAEVFHHSREAIIISDAKGTILNVNPGFSRITGYSREEVIGQNPRLLKYAKQKSNFYKQLFRELYKKGSWAGEFWNKRKNGERYLQRGTISSVVDEHGDILHFIAIMDDVSQHIQAEKTIERLANYDQLTGLPNRVLLKERFMQVQFQSYQDGESWALLFIDLDEFKQVNDALGHHYGDELLVLVAERLKLHVRERDTLCRFGGDEFIVLMQGHSKDASLLAQRLIYEVSQSYQIREDAIKIGASVGIAMFPQDGDTLDAIIQAADTAMYQAKAQGRNRHEFFAQKMQDRVQHHLNLKQDLDNAITNNELCLYYQPKFIYSCGSATKMGYEALIRWNKPGKGMISPAEFIPVAEASGQIADIDMWVLNKAVEKLVKWRENGTVDPLPIAINLSASLFSKQNFVQELERILSTFHIPAHWLELEITEHVVMLNMEYTLRTLAALKKLGVGLAIDDFGTGYSSLSYLQQFPIDTLKIDLSFVRNVHLDVKKQGIVKAIINMAHSLDLKTIAEGVECLEELDFLDQEHCDQYQGYYFSKPMLIV